MSVRELGDEGLLYKEGMRWYYDESYRPIILRKLELKAEQAMTLYRHSEGAFIKSVEFQDRLTK